MRARLNQFSSNWANDCIVFRLYKLQTGRCLWGKTFYSFFAVFFRVGIDYHRMELTCVIHPPCHVVG